ncbi:MAG: aromatic/alkene monooxygenase hydroxylase subunit beta [Pseudomonadota bacterium]|nr:aromatic/alkene monooxygenase hydroxylase subunit beta [Pseudomonadota bacterium]
MHIDLQTINIKPLRQTYDNVARHIGGDKPATRYQEATLGLQPTSNFHYRPSWDPDHEIFDASRTALVMADWYAFKDPRQYYYGSYTLARARQQEAAESAFEFVEERNLCDALDAGLAAAARDLLVPLRHVAWGANMNHSSMCAYGYGTAITQPCLFQAMDQLGIAQYLTRTGLLLGGPALLDAGKQAWIEGAEWQPLRHLVEDCLVIEDWFEMFVAQNLAIDGQLYPLVYGSLVEGDFAGRGGIALSMLTGFMRDWHAETLRWVDAQIRTAVGESEANKALVQGWLDRYRGRARDALAGLARRASPAQADAMLDDCDSQFRARIAKLGLSA